MAIFMGRSRTFLAAIMAAGSIAGLTAGVARADDVDAQLAAYENEARELADDLPRPNRISGAAGQRRLIDAEVAYSLGEYDSAALMLFELATKPGADQEAATFYLAESLFQKGDRGAARGYYEHLTARGNVASRYYQPSLARLIEIAIGQKDDTNVGQYTAALDQISSGLRLPVVPYIRGKLAYSQDKPDEAIAYFQDVPKGSDYELQAAYYLATTYILKQDFQRATDIFTDLIGKKPRTANDRRVIELSQLALGRLYYERDQASKSIDSYLLVDRHSELFPDALYEVAWVYVKGKQYDKALRALELLALSDPASTKTPTVRILEGNLRIRKAQMVRGAQIQGTLDNQQTDDPATEYDKAARVFTETHDMYMPSYTALAQMVASNADPAQYLQQIAGRSEHVFQAIAPMPEAAVQYMRDEPEVQRVVAVEGDLGEITASLSQTEATIARLEGVLAAADSTAVYPALATRRSRIVEIQDDLLKIRSDLAEQMLRLVDGSGELAQLSARRRQLYASYAAAPNAERAAAEHLVQHQAQYDALERSVADVDGVIGATQAVAVALRKYAGDTPEFPASQNKTVTDALDEAARDAQAIESELDALHKELQIGRDLPGIGDAEAAARVASKQLKDAEDAEDKVLAGRAAASRDRDKAQKLAALAGRAARISAALEQDDRQIAALVAQGLQEVRAMLAQEKTNLAACKADLADYEAEARALGSGVLAASEQTVKAKLYDIVIRTDVGNVDVAWSQKEDVDDDLKRLNLSRQREFKQLKDEFKDILDTGTPKPSAPAKKPEVSQPQASSSNGSPDKSAGAQRVAPGADLPSPPASSMVQSEPDTKQAEPKPDAKSTNPKPDAKPTNPKNAGAKSGAKKADPKAPDSKRTASQGGSQ